MFAAIPLVRGYSASLNSRPSRRYGVEWTNYYIPSPWLAFDADFSFSQSEFKDSDPVGYRNPGSIEEVIAPDAAVHDLDYYHVLRLVGAPGVGVDDIHFHLVEPAQCRSTWAAYF